MTNTKFATGAFVFTRARGIDPLPPEELLPVAARHGLASEYVPAYAGDRTAFARALTLASSGLHREGFLLRPIKRSANEVIYGVVREQRREDDRRLDHDFEAIVAWSAEPDPAVVVGEHPVAERVAGAYRQLRGTVTADDWSSVITSYLDNHDAARVRGDGRVYWVPPQRLDEIRQFGAFLADVGIDLVLCEIEAESRTVVKHVAADNLNVQLDQLEAEVEQFDGTQKPSTYARRLDAYQRLRERAGLYRDALGLGVSRAEQVLSELEQKVSAMLDLRQRTVIPRRTQPTNESTSTPKRPQAAVRFAGVTFHLLHDADSELTFASGDEHAKASLASLDAMGLADRWQSAGPAQVKIKNSGPPGADVTLIIRRPSQRPLTALSASLAGLGIELCD